MNKRFILILSLVFLASLILVIPVGRYPVSALEIVSSLWERFFVPNPSLRAEEVSYLFLSVRLPRILAAILVGSSLSLSGAVYQSIFRNPLVSPGILGVLAGASTGAAVGIVVFSSWVMTQLLSLVGGICGVTLSLTLSRLYPRSPLLALLVGGLVSSSFFSAVTSLFKYLADTDNQLPELVYWLMGTLSRATGTQLSWVAPLMVLGVLYLTLCGRVVNALSLGDEEAMSLGVDSRRERLKLIGLATMICSLSVVIAGIINWVGLVIPHVVRLIIGPNNLTLLPASAILGALFVLLTDTLTRSFWTAEFPLGIFTSLICLPLFAVSLWKAGLDHD
ncbi:MAG: iron ABC transporter permease [Deltaproteobacteria bacterium]|jgi:iron complex transport system permease protein|nr:iron ABC transporter permease [Deltaproteobacteria bacterium]